MKIKYVIFLVFLVSSLFANQSLVDIIANAKPYSKIEIPNGVFKGPIIIKKPLILVGIGRNSIIENDGNDTVITILSPHVSIKNITIRGSGHQRYKLDSGIKVQNSSYISIQNCNINQTLFGIILDNTSNSIVINNLIESYKEPIVDNRGDGIRLWQSNGNQITNNHIFQSRDISLSRSHYNIVKNNLVENSRYGVLLDMCKDTNVTSNKIISNYAGIMSMNSKKIYITNNTIIKTHLSTGIGIMLSLGKKMYVLNNTISGSSQAFYIDSSVAEIGMQRHIKFNKIINNNIAFHFHSTIKNNLIQNNNIIGNLEDVVKDIKENKKYKNSIKLNYWDRYIGFDKNHDNISDIPYQVLIYADKLWQFHHNSKFFYGTPLLSIVDFIERLAPFSEPVLLLEDKEPRTLPIKNMGKF